MATITKTFAFATTAEGFTATAPGATTLTYDAATGNPAGALKATSAGKNNALTVSYWQWTGTYSSLGVPAGATINSVTLSSASTRCTQYTTGRSGTQIGPYELYDSGLTLIGTLWSGRSITTTDGAWVSTGTQSAVDVSALSHTDSTTISIRLSDSLGTGNSNSAVVTSYDDQVVLIIDYSAPPTSVSGSEGPSITITESSSVSIINTISTTDSCAVTINGSSSVDTGGGATNITLRATSWYTLDSAATPVSSHVFSIPSGTQVGDFMVLSFVTNGVAVNSLTGWTTQFTTSVVTNPKGRVFTKFADSTDVSTGTVTVSTSSTTYGSGSISSFINVDVSNPIDSLGTMLESTATITAFTVSSFNTVSNDALLIGGVGSNTGNSSTPWTGQPSSPGAWAWLANPATGAGGATTVGKSFSTSYYQDMTTAGATGSLTWTLASARAGFAWAMALKPSTGVVTGTLISRWTGASTSDGATVSVQTSSATSVRLKVATDSGLTTGVVFSSPATPDAQGYALLSITGLSANTQYYYGVEVDGTVNAIKQGAFKTLPTVGSQASFSFALASCMNSGADTNAASRIVTRNPLFMMQMGDFHYDNNSTNDQSLFRASIEAQVARTNISSMLANVPTTYVWSDHDWGGNNSNGTAASAPAAQAVYRQIVPSHPLPVTDSIQRTFVVGRVRFIITDERSFKSVQSSTDDSSKTMLGTVQKQWLKDTITNATEPVIFWQGDTSWVGPVVAGDDHWASYSTERAELGAFFAASGKTIIRLAGDMHAVAADDGTNSVGGIAVLQAAPLNQSSSIKGGPYSQGAFPASGSTTVRQYGWVDVTDNGSNIVVNFTGYDTSDTSQVTLSKTINLATPVTTNDSAAISISSSSQIANTQPSTESSAISVTETSAISVTLSSTDSCAVTATEGTSQVASNLIGAEACAVTVVESSAAAITNAVTTTDACAITATEGAATISVNGTGTDTCSITIAEQVAEQFSVTASDACAVTVTESPSTIVILTFITANDACAVTVTEGVSQTKNSFTTIESCAVGASDISNAIAASFGSADACAITVTEGASASAGMAVTTDACALTISESSSLVILNTISTTDACAVAATEGASQVGVILSASDTTAVAVADSSLDASSSPGSEAPTITIVESSSIIVGFATADSCTLTINDSSSLDTGGGGVTDSCAVTVSEAVELFQQNPTGDAFLVAITEASTITSSLGRADVCAITITEASTSQIQLSRTEPCAIAITETSSILITLASSDTCIVTSDEQVGGQDTFVSGDTSAISVHETSQVRTGNKTVNGYYGGIFLPGVIKYRKNGIWTEPVVKVRDTNVWS